MSAPPRGMRLLGPRSAPYDDPPPHFLQQPEDEGCKPVTDPEWEWPCFSRYVHNGRVRVEPLKKYRGSATSGRVTPFTVTYTERESGDPQVHVTLASGHLVDVLKRIYPESKASSSETPELLADTIFLALATLKKQLEAVKDEEAERRCHLQHLVRFVEQEFKETIVRRDQMEAKGTVSFDMLWTFMLQDEPVRFLCNITNRPRLGTLLKPPKRNQDGGIFRIGIQAMSYNVQSYRHCAVQRYIEPFDGQVPFTALPVCPMRFFGADRARMEAAFLQTGERFFDLAMSSPFRFVAYTGFLAYETERSVMKRKADGRVMVDLCNFARMHPGYPLADAHPPTDILRSAVPQLPKPKEEVLKLAPAVVYGFSFNVKQWGCFDVMGFSDICFDSAAFNELVLQDPEQKDMLLGLVRQYVEQQAPPLNLDAISTKGVGCIFLCYGPPGTGKTLTAESLAEKLQCPLWAMNAFELPGSDPGAMEARLLQIFEIAVSWKAILLLDEADVYMECRRSGGSTTAMTGVFLRLLEYYAGVLFLTTNRVAVFDEAFRSRISMLVEYPPLSQAQREAIWAKLLSKTDLPTAEAKDLAVHSFNGREIRNMLRVALTWAESCKRKVSMQEVRSVVRMSIAGLKALKEAATANSAAEDGQDWPDKYGPDTNTNFASVFVNAPSKGVPT